MAALERVRASVTSRPASPDGQAFAVTFSAGLAVFTGDPDTVDTLLARADMALYAAKAQGRDRVMPRFPVDVVPLR